MIVGDIQGTAVPIQETSGNVTIGTPSQPGDANCDGLINSQDITAVERQIAELDPQQCGSDANEDGELNALDITKTELIIAQGQ